MDSKRPTRRRSVLARLMTGGAVLLLFVLLVSPGDAAPGVGVVSPTTTIAVQQALATNAVAMGWGGCSWVHIPDWMLPRSPCQPPWVPQPPIWIPQPPIWIPQPPIWIPQPPVWTPGPPVWVPRPPVWFGPRW